jgi:L-lysine 6-transaminase
MTFKTLPINISIDPSDVHRTLKKHMAVEGMPIVIDLEKSRGTDIIDAKTGRRYIDLFSFFASLPVGMNHPKLHESEFEEKLLRAARTKTANPDAFTVEFAEFVETFANIAKPGSFIHTFFIEGGALGVENALKAAFDWKVRKNFERGYAEEKGHQVVHFRQAFHGRTGYTMSLTNTNPLKVKHYPRFKWPRAVNPALRFPITAESIEDVKKLESQSLAQVKEAFREHMDDIAAIIIEPIQSEGGDNHFRKEFLQELRTLADENEAMLIFDEVQTGLGITGKMWAYEWFVEPDMIVFGKKTQVCGFMSTKRIDEVEDNVFSSVWRINSTWGGSLTDMVRATQYLQIIEEEGLVENAHAMGEVILKSCTGLAREYPDLISNARGRGLLCAIDLPSERLRDRFRRKLLENGVIMLTCGERSMRFRPPLDIREDTVNEAIDIMRSVLSNIDRE